jgi:argininosuccinate lyase
MNNVYRSRLSEKAERTVARFVSSLEEDIRIFDIDIEGTEAHNIMLFEQGVLTRNEVKQILTALEKLRETRLETMKFTPDFEDVHEFIESYVIKEVGLEVGGKLHTGRSRNDQIALDLRVHLRSELNEIALLTVDLLDILLQRAREFHNTPWMFYTHTQHAQVGSLSHYLLAYVDVFLRDLRRFQECYKSVNLSPLGTGPVGGTAIKINRERTAKLLGFVGIIDNSIDATSSRDFMLEAASALAIFMSGISRIAEDLILWSSTEFGFVEIDDRYASVSSIMPQKKNPTVLELLRGKTGRVYGNLMSLLTTVKGLSTGYSSDLQDTKPSLWNSLDTVKGSVQVLTGVLATLKVDVPRIRELLATSYAFAVDLAENLTTKTELSFREAHIVVGNLVQEMVKLNMTLNEVTCEAIEAHVKALLNKTVVINREVIQNITDPQRALVARRSLGSPSPKEVTRILKTRRCILKQHRKQITTQNEQVQSAKNRLQELVRQLTS